MKRYIINYNGILYYIFYIKNRLILHSKNINKQIDLNIKKYFIKYYRDKIFVAYYKKKSSIVVFIYNLIDGTSSYEKMEVNNIGNIADFIFMINESSYSLVVTTNNTESKNVVYRVSPYSKYEIENILTIEGTYHNIFYESSMNIILIDVDKKRGSFLLYRLLGEKIVLSYLFQLPNVTNIKLLKVVDGILIFYNRKGKKNIELFYRRIFLGYTFCGLDIEKKVINSNTNHIISYYNNKLYIISQKEISVYKIINSELFKINEFKLENSNMKTEGRINKIQGNSEEVFEGYILVNISKSNEEKEQNTIYEKNIYNEKIVAKDEALDEELQTKILQNRNQYNNFNSFRDLIQIIKEKDKIIDSILVNRE